MIDSADAQSLIELARDSISCVFENKFPELDDKLKQKLSEPQGVFVTLTKDDNLRGCIGFVEPVFPLYEAVIRAARAAAFEDPRFPRLQKGELKLIKVELSVLTKPELIEVEKPEDYLKRIEIGKHGLIIRGQHGSGLLLPQVFSEYNCSPEQALEMTCEKAFLPKDAWKELENKVFRFEALVFEEKGLSH